MRRSCHKDIRDPNQKCSVRLNALFIGSSFPASLRGWQHDDSIDLAGESGAGLPPEPTGQSKVSPNPTKLQRTKYKKKSAECALYRCECFNCGVAARQVASSHR